MHVGMALDSTFLSEAPSFMNDSVKEEHFWTGGRKTVSYFLSFVIISKDNFSFIGQFLRLSSVFREYF